MSLSEPNRKAFPCFASNRPEASRRNYTFAPPNGKQAPLYCYRNKDKKEINLLIVQDDIIYPLGLKKSAKVDTSIVQQFKALNKFNKKLQQGGSICLVDSLTTNHAID